MAAGGSAIKARYWGGCDGYGDGYPRYAKAGTPVLVNGKRVPLIGRVSMDMITVDLATHPTQSRAIK